MKKNTKRSDQSLKSIIPVLVTISILLFLSIFFIKNRNPICNDRVYDNGWECSYPSFFFPESDNWSSKYEEKCINEGGEYSSLVVTEDMVDSAGGFSMEKEGPIFYCSIPLSDSGESCSSSDDCEGSCQYTGDIPSSCEETEPGTYSCSLGIQGTCSKTKDLGTACLYETRVEENILKTYHCIQ